MINNGLCLLSLWTENELLVIYTTCKHQRSNHWHLLDYVIGRQRDGSSALISRAMRTTECWTDHHLVISKILLAVCRRVKRTANIGRRLNVALLRSEHLMHEYSNLLQSRLARLELSNAAEG